MVSCQWKKHNQGKEKRCPTFCWRALIRRTMRTASMMAPRPTMMRGKLETTLVMVSSFCTLAADASSITTLYPKETETTESSEHHELLSSGLVFCVTSIWKLCRMFNTKSDTWMTIHWCFAVLSAFSGFLPHSGTWQGTQSHSGF